MKNETTCTKCILPQSYPDIHFDDNGVCNYCNYYDTVSEHLNDFEKHERLLDERILMHKGKGEKYDVLVGLSGGKDSTYVLYYLKKKYNLRILAYTYDNHYLTDYAYNNIRIALDALEVPHIQYRKNWSLMKALYQKSVEKAGYICYGCALPGYWSTVEIASEMGIPMIVGGRSRGQIFHSLLKDGKDFAIPSIWQNLNPYDEKAHSETIKAFHDAITLVVHWFFDDDPVKRDEILSELFPFPDTRNLKNGILPEILNLFLYIPYDEKKFMDTLHKEIGWKKPKIKGILTHSDCFAHDAADYMYYKYYGRQKIVRELSVLIREGVISREEAIKRGGGGLEEPSGEIEKLLNYLEIDRDSLPHI